jgi:DNA-binding MurR/RpiR family transcriptional regulator
MAATQTFERRISVKLPVLRPAETRVARYLQEHPEEAVLASAATLAEKTETSDATVIRTARALGYNDLEELRRAIATQMRGDLSPAARLTRTRSDVGGDVATAFSATIDTHIASLEALRRDISVEQLGHVVDRLLGARRIVVFGIGPSRAMSNYFAFQLSRFGFEASSLSATGLLLADGLSRLRAGDVVVMLAYGRLYAEVDALLDHARRLQLPTILLTDSLASVLAGRVTYTLKVARGRTDMMSLHTATLGLIEAVLVSVAARRPEETIASLKKLNKLRRKLAGRPMDLNPGRRSAIAS